MYERAMERVRGTLQRFPRSLWLLAAANFILFTARGMTMPFLVIFFGQIVGLGEGMVGAGIFVNAVVGVVFTLAVAGLIDRLGARLVLIATIVGVAVMTASFPLATTPSLFFLVMVLHGCASQLYWPASDTFATSMVSMDQMGEMFALLRVANALGIGAGGLLGGLIVAGGTLDQYRVLYLSSGAGIALAALMIVTLVRRPGTAVPSPRAGSANAGSWREVLADRRYIFSQVVMFILLAAFTQLQVSAPPFLRKEAGVSEAVIGLLFAINTVIVVALQIPVAARIGSWGRGTTFAVAALFWIVAYAMIGASPWLSLLPFAAIIIYTVGEMLFMPTTGVLVVELAPERLRGRYLAGSSVTWGLAWGVASWGSGAILGSSSPLLLWPALIGVLIVGGLGGLLFDRMGGTRRAAAPAVQLGDGD
jgi:MFS family permease